MVGHKKQFDLLKKKFESEKLSHAYLFVGENQIGKKTFAKEFVKLVNCKEENRPCGVCKTCRDIEKEVYPDFLLVKSDKEIEVSQIRDAQNFLSYKSYYGSFKSVIIDEAERMNTEAQNCFLKTLEEPKGDTLIILVSAHPELMLPTIFSRCQTVKFYPLLNKEVKRYLLDLGAKEKVAESLTTISQGKLGRAVDLFTNPDKLEKEQKSLEELIKVINSNLAEKFQYTKKINLEEGNLKGILEVLQRYLRHLLFKKTGAESLANEEYFPEAEGNLKTYSVSKIKDILKLIEKLNTQTLVTNASPKLALEILLMEM